MASRGTAVAAGVLALSGCSLLPAPGGTASSPAAPPSTVATSGATSGPGRSVGLPSVALPSTTTSRSCSDRVLGAKQVRLRGSQGSVHPTCFSTAFAMVCKPLGTSPRTSRRRAGAPRSVVTTVVATYVVGWAVPARLSAHVSSTWTVRRSLVVTSALPPTSRRTPSSSRPSRRPRSMASWADARTRRFTSPADLAPENSGICRSRRVGTDGLEPKERNFAAWQTTRDGMRLTFQDGQLGAPGLRTVTVPWRTVRPLLSAYGTGLLDPDIDQSTC